jgi:subtilisin family serine protease
MVTKRLKKHFITITKIKRIMKNKKLLVVSLLCALISIESFSQTGGKRYYYAFDEKIFLDSVENKMVISFQSNNVTVIQTLTASTETEWQNDSIYIVTVANSQMEAFKDDLLQLGGIKSVQPMFAVDGMEMGVTNEIVMKFHNGVSQQEIDSLHAMYQASVIKTTDLYQLITVSNTADALEIANQYQLSGLVDYSHPNFLAQVERHQVIPNDPYFVNQFYLHNTGQTVNGRSGAAGADIRAPQAWNITKGSSNIIIAVLDEGVTSDHPDLPNSRQVRLNGSNFVTTPYTNNPSPSWNDNHGNACAGIIAASHNNEGIAGIAPNCKIMPIRIPFGFALTSVLVDAIDFAKNNGAHVLSNSWGYNSTNPNLYPHIRRAIEDATLSGRGGKGCIVVFSAGNTANHATGRNGGITFPANVTVAGVLTVGASDRYDQQANYSPTSDLSSPQNQIIDILAPSHRAYSCQIATETFEIWTIDIPGAAGYNPVKSNDCISGAVLPPRNSTLPSSGTNHLAYTGYFGGTSAACPQVAGVAALILSLNPELTQKQVSDIIKSTARKAGNYTYQITPEVDDNNTWNPRMGHGVLNAYAALQATQETLPYNILGTVFPFVHYNNDQINNHFKVTVRLYAPPPPGLPSPINYLRNPNLSTPLYQTTAVLYNGSVYVPGTPKNPGVLGSLVNPGTPIDWSSTGKTPDPTLTVDTTTIKPDEVPGKPVGLYYFEAIPPGEYILSISRGGFVCRFVKITVPVSGKCIIEHKEIIGGDATGTGRIESGDINLVNSLLGYSFGDSEYNGRYDINGNRVIDIGDVSLVKFYQGFHSQGYTETNNWVIEYRQQ